jgi:uncharacterized membrane protein HdeD (DUF308 family)
MSVASSTSSLEHVLQPIARHWWLWVLFGVLSIVAGVIALANPGLSLLAIALLFGCALIISGFFDLLTGITARDVDTIGRVAAMLLGVLALIAGVICLRRPGTSLLALVLVVGIYLIAAGVLHLAAAFSDREGNTALRAALGLLNIVLGVVILAIPGLSLVTFAVLFGIGLVIRGAVAIAAGMRLRRLRPATERRGPHAAHPAR